jgi:hypothetical protein
MTFWDKILAALTAIATGTINFSKRVWFDLSIAIRRDGAIYKTGKDPGAAAFAHMDALKPSDMATVVAAGLEGLMKAGFDVTGEAFKPVTDALLTVHRKKLDTLKNVEPGDEEKTASELLDEAIGAGIGAHFAAVVAETLYPTKNLGVPAMAALMAELSGFGEIMAGIIGPEMRALVAQPHTYKVNSRARSLQPSMQEAATMVSRRLIGEAHFDELAGYAGMTTKYVDALRTAAFKAPSPFQLLRGLGLLNIDKTPAVEALKFGGLRDQDIDQLISAGERQGRQSLLSAVANQVVKLASAGLMSDAEVDQQLIALDLTTDARALFKQHIGLARLEALATAHKKELDEAAKAKLIDIATYRAGLAAVGFQSTEIDIFAGAISNFLDAKMLAEEARQQSAENRAEREKGALAALAAFRHGDIDEANYTAALVALGFSPKLAASYVEMAKVGMEPTIAAGKTLSKYAQKQADQKSQLKAAIERYKKGEIDAHAAQTLFEAFGMTPAEANAEIAYQNALALKGKLKG